MSPEDKLAVEECLVLWKYLVQSGEKNKEKAVNKLHKQGRLSKDSYENGCPFCAQFDCHECPWRTVPNNEGSYLNCLASGSPFISWPCLNKKETQKAASAVYKFLKQIKV